MESILSWIGLGIGAVGALLGIALGRGESSEQRPQGTWLVAAVTVVISVVFFFLTFLSRPPFTPGHMLGDDILIGGVLGAIAGVFSSRGTTGSVWKDGIAVITGPSIALFGLSLVLLIFPGYSTDAIAGMMIGAIVSTVLFRLALPVSETVMSYGLATATVGATVYLASWRYDEVATRFWWRAPLIVLGSVIIAQIVAAATAKEGRKVTIPALVGSVITLALLAVFAWRIFPQWSLFYVAAAGIGTFALVAWLALSAPNSRIAASLAVIVVLALSAFAFREMAGFGLGIGLIAAWSILLPAIAAEDRSDPDQNRALRAIGYARFIGIGVLLCRLFIETYENFVTGIDVRAQYTLVALGIGAILPFVLFSFFPISSRRSAAWRTAGAGFAGFFAAVIPLAVLVLWGFKAALGLLVGTIAAEIFILMISMGALDVREKQLTESAVLVLAAQMSLVQFAYILSEYTDTTRLVKIIILACLAVVAIVWAWISARLAREA